jgi:predicted esterase
MRLGAAAAGSSEELVMLRMLQDRQAGLQRIDWTPVSWTAIFLAVAALVPAARAETVTLKNGLRLEGSPGNISTIGGDPLAAAGAGGVKVKQIVILDDQLRRMFVGTNQVVAMTPTTGSTTERILIPQRVSFSGRAIGGVGPIVRVTPFDEFGRRIFTMVGHDGHLDIVQGITEITPKHCKVEAIQGAESYVWTLRIATSSIPREQLSKIIYHVIDTSNSDQRLRVVRLYLQAERYQDARAELEQLIKEFPDLAHLQDQVKTLRQLSAQRLLKEIELRQAAGQYRRSIVLLENFPGEGVAGETLLKVRDMLGELGELKAQGDKVKALLAEHQAAMKDDKVREAIKPIVDEILRDLNVNTLDRMADYLRLSDDASLSVDQKLSLAISGWLLGSGSGVDNLAVSQSLVQVRNLVRKYLVTTRKPDRDLILAELESLEGATPTYIARLVAHMKPPLETEVVGPAVDPGDPAAILALPPEESSAPEKAAAKPAAKPAEPPPPAEPTPAACDDDGGASILDGGPMLPPVPPTVRRRTTPVAAASELSDADAPAPPVAEEPKNAVAGATGIPGLFELKVAGLPEDPEITYYVQLPPEYDPYRRYPCIVTLHGAGTTAQQQIDWWAGGYNSESQTRFGQASRHGYIVLAPAWTREHQHDYEYSAREHAAVLLTLRDATKRLSIDTDRVFLSGHSMGGDAAWDIGLAHPDLWAGVIPIVATADKYVTRYWRNAKYVPLYFVGGEKDGNKLTLNATDWDRYLKHLNFDTLIVLYQGRGHEHFHDEIQNLFDWMNLHKRDFFPREFEVDSLRPWDNFFWWVETRKPNAANIILPAEWGKRGTPASTEGKVLATNGVTVKASCDEVTIWLSPEIVDFANRMTITVNGRRQPNNLIQPSASTLLEDVRTRGDRQHPFWAKVQN